ncbi:MAG: endopeptidase La [Anaerolineales bacterium]|nr:endopeptidase La [Anaerolineales bacterium]
MRRLYLHWPTVPVDFGESFTRRTEDLGRIKNAELTEDGVIECAVLPLKDVVLYPNMLTPLFVNDEIVIATVEDAIRLGNTMIAVAQHDPDLDHPGSDDFYQVGTEIAIGRLMQAPDGTTTILTQGRQRVEIIEFIEGTVLRARARPMPEDSKADNETLAIMRAVLTLFEKCAQLNQNIPEEAIVYAMNIEQPGWLGDLVASSLSLTLPERQAVLEIFDPVARLQHISVLLGRELDVLELEDKIHSQVQSEVDRSQREMYLREQMRVIQRELGEGDLWAQDISELRKKVEHLHLPEDVHLRVLKEVERLSQMPPISPESSIVRAYVNWVIELPWTETTEDNLDVRHAGEILERDHYALKKAKDRILEYIAVRNLAATKQKQPILCFVGPPGTGKTSIGKSIAEALGRKFVRLSLGGVRDEAEIRGHRRTYIGALPGRILQTMHHAGTRNPLFMLDEVDKLGHDFRGDPSAALLEVLDPEQNHSFSDHYIEMPYDLSKVMFITTANTLDPIPPALLDRMEVIEFPSYILEEKVIIATRFLIPRQLEQNGFSRDEIAFTKAALYKIIREYTWEAGVRNLEREIGNIIRKVARRKAEGRKFPRRITPDIVDRYIGPPQITPPRAEKEDMVGVATALAWTENGGEIMAVEVLLVEGKGGLQITGQIGDVMQESAQAALSYVKARSRELELDPEIFEKTDIHVHIPEGAIPKDGPSAGITICTALASALTSRPVKHTVGMSGEITLRGRVLPIGGVREKIMAGYRLQLGTAIIPTDNEKDLSELPRKVRDKMDIRLVSTMDEVLDLSLQPSA